MWWRNAPIHIDGGQSGYVKHVLTWKQGPPSALMEIQFCHNQNQQNYEKQAKQAKYQV